MIVPHSPAEILATVFYKSECREIEDNQRFYGVFDEVSRSSESDSFRFASHPQYGYSPGLDEALNILMLGGSIVMVGKGITIRSSDHTLGSYWERVFEEFDDALKQDVSRAAEKLRVAFPVMN